ncbi:hypothetical protein KKD19_02460 [Patescibacteria group bacterium]|nr:hypothetical protein [Patescibacteria group bacterium]MBU4512085.1 hypothetical protein [Patescibacteria group bacterium]MCG2693410.1 hypothetical protein [Candidatus Parcubacteria bacterium]
MCWCFAIINNRLAEIYFDRDKKGNPKFEGHCYVKRSEFKTKVEQKAIDEDITKYRFSYRKGEYRRVEAKKSNK